jgi:cytidyltransferase-like protein
MRTVHTAAGLEDALSTWRSDGATIAFVPTMGALHEGHLSLIALARRHAPRVVASIFVNPTQFAPHEDFASYPRHPERDAALLARAGCDLLFLPDRETIYPESFGTWIEPRGAALGLESEVRPHFFRGVATVVARLFRLVRSGSCLARAVPMGARAEEARSAPMGALGPATPRRYIRERSCCGPGRSGARDPKWATTPQIGARFGSRVPE